ncbi:MAG: DUF5597 domain-containing protein [Lachnospiraceae bacterium]|jgi:beta-galactosidase GanA|nr:DUF5597 domain-containing protein [Lachnospiraceae bacterium]
MVDDAPFLILGGELHNSSGSDLGYMEKNVWPGLRRLGGNCYLTPVYWECMEPEPEKYDFTLVDGVIEQARREGVRLILLWFGLWKNGNSSYVPAWIKTNPDYFYMHGIDGKMIESVSPFCEEAVDLDQRAFCRLMEHLRIMDEERTVIMVQVENEVGIWMNPRDYGSRANELFYREIPEEMAELYGASGTWEEAFGVNACEYFMSWGLSRAVGRIAEKGKESYNLPLFMNCVAMGLPLRAGQLPSGGPLPRVHKIWRKFAPTIDLYGPDIYSPFYKEVSSDFASANALMVPELSQDKNSASKALFTVAAYNTICFSPFGIDGLMTPLSENDLLAQMNTDLNVPQPCSGELLAEAYRILRMMWPDICKAQEEGRIYAFLQQNEPGAEFILDDYIINVTYGDGGMRGFMGQAGHRKEDAPIGGGFIIRQDTSRFLVCGLSCNVQVNPKYAEQAQVFVLDKREIRCTEEGLVPGRILNGDERNFMALGAYPCLQELAFYRK